MIKFEGSGIVENLFDFIEVLNKYKKSQNEQELSEILKEYNIDPIIFSEFLKERDSVSELFNNVFKIRVFDTTTNKNLFDLFIDVFSVLKYFISYMDKLKYVYSLPDNVVLDILESFGFNEAKNIQKHVSKASFLNNLHTILSKKGNALGIDTLLSYFLKNKNIGNLYEWWIYYKGKYRGTATDYDFVFKPKIAWSDWVYKEEEDIEILYPDFISNVATWYYSKQGNVKISDLYKELYLDIFPVSTSYLSFCFLQNNFSKILNYSFYNKYLEECYHYFVRDVLYEKYSESNGKVLECVTYDNSWFIVTTYNGDYSVFVLETEGDYVTIDNTTFIINSDSSLITIDNKFVDYLPNELLLTPRQPIYIDDSAYEYNIRAYKNLRFIPVSSLEDPLIYISVLDSYYLLYLLNNYDIFEVHEYIGYFKDSKDIEILLSVPLKRGSYFVTPEHLYVSNNNKWFIAKSLFFENKYDENFRLSGTQLLFLFPVKNEPNIRSDNSVLTLNKQITFLNRELHWYDFYQDLEYYFGDITNHLYELILPYRLISNSEEMKELYYKCFDITFYDWIDDIVQVMNMSNSKLYEQYKALIENERYDRILSNIESTFFKRNLLDNNLVSNLIEVVSIPKCLRNFIKIENNSILVEFNSSVIDTDFVEIFPERVFPLKSHNNRAIFVSYPDLIFEADIEFYGIVSIVGIIFNFYVDETDYFYYYDMIYFDSSNNKGKVYIDLSEALKDKVFKGLYKITFKINNAVYEQKSGLVIKNIKLTINTSSDSYKYIKNSFDNTFNIIQLDQDDSFKIANIRKILNPLLLFNTSLNVVKHTDMYSYIENNKDNIIQNDLIVFDMDEDGNLKSNDFCIVKFFEKNKDTYNDIDLLIVLPRVKSYNSSEKRSICGFEFKLNYASMFSQDIDVKVSALKVPEHRLYKFNTLINSINNKKIDIYSIILTKNSGLYRTFFNLNQVNIIRINISFKNIQKKYKTINSFIVLEFSKFKIDKDIIFGFKKNYNSIAPYSIDFLKVSNYNVLNRIKDKIEYIIRNSRDYVNDIRMFFEYIVDDIYSFYVQNDIGINKDFIKEVCNFNFNERFKIFRNVLEYYKPLRCVLLPNINVYKINTFEQYIIPYDNVVNIKNDIFWNFFDTSSTFNINKYNRTSELKLFTYNKEYLNYFTYNIRDTYSIFKYLKDIYIRIKVTDNEITLVDSRREFNKYENIFVPDLIKSVNVSLKDILTLNSKEPLNLSKYVQENENVIYYEYKPGLYYLDGFLSKDNVEQAVRFDFEENILIFDHSSTEEYGASSLFMLELDNEKLEVRKTLELEEYIYTIKTIQNTNIKKIELDIDYMFRYYDETNQGSIAAIIFGNFSSYMNILYNTLNNNDILYDVPSILDFILIEPTTEWNNISINKIVEYPTNSIFIVFPHNSLLKIKLNKIILTKGE